MVNKDGDLELYAVHDTPKQASWSARGDLAISAGLGCKVIPGFQDRGVPPQPWDVIQETTATTRGRTKTASEPMFGKGDEDGFPALESKVSPSKVVKARTYSPASFRYFPLEHSLVRSELSVPPNGVRDQVTSKPPAEDASKSKGHQQPAESSSPRAKHSSRIVEDDISMMMRRRAVRGYGLASVSVPHMWAVNCDLFPQAKHNAQVVLEGPCTDTTLSELWAWIHRAFVSYGSTSSIVERTSQTQMNLYVPRRREYTDMNFQTKDFLDYGKDSNRCLRSLSLARRLLASLTAF